MDKTCDDVIQEMMHRLMDEISNLEFELNQLKCNPKYQREAIIEYYKSKYNTIGKIKHRKLQFYNKMKKLLDDFDQSLKLSNDV